MATAAAPQTVGEGSSVRATPPAVAASPEPTPQAVAPGLPAPDKNAPAVESVPPVDATAAAEAAPAIQPDAPLDVRVAAEGQNIAGLDAELECMAKVVHHEAANQSLRGQLAVAQLILNRLKSPLFPKTICAVVNQPGQFFQTRAWPAPVHSPRWHTSVAIARIAREANMPEIAPGALFYHAAFVTPSWSRRRVKVGRIGENVFYR
jgi:spore germination cell wall hydrolase CwlJ-like protein